ncbi:efflux RND transporter permease subunit [Candidatus Peregrinibacteria bacterium]|nr:MAG: efflux RND transporter permease subunit [Candidatus Peregrinibacteria bacterium]
MENEHYKAQIDSVRHSFWAFFINNWRVTLVVLFGLIVGGYFGLTLLPQESDPEVKIPIGTVTTIYPGASPADVEELITDKIERRLKSLDHLKRITSSSLEGVSSIVVEFEASADLDQSIRELRDEVDLVKSDLPEDVEDPAVLQIRASDVPIVTLSLVGNFPPESFKIWGEELEDRIESINGVSKVNLSGVEQKEMQVLINVQKLEGYGFSLNQVVNAIQSHHIDFPIGNILTDKLYYQASLKGQMKTARELMDLPIANVSGSNVYLRDVAEVREVFKESTNKTRLYQADTQTYKQSITLQVYKKTGANIIEVVEAAKAEAFAYQKEALPPSTDILVTGDNSEFIREDLTTLSRSGLQSVLIIFFTLFFALGLKEGLLAALSIPLIFLITFLVLLLVGKR